MFKNFPLFPEQAARQAGQVDALYFFLLAVAGFFSLLIAISIVVFAVKYRRRRADEVGAAIHGSLALELLWTVIPFFIVMFTFVWGAKVFFDLSRPPAGAMEIYVVGKQWMWKIQHQGGQREINQLHIPVGRPIKLTLGSEDVIHDFFVPAFRVKADVIPGRYNTLWFEATKPGTYHIFCAQYCGTKHSGMVGSVIAMEPAAFQAWLSSGGGWESPIAAGEKLFNDLACSSCHRAERQGRGPVLANLFGSKVELEGGATVTADEGYIRESIVNPQAKITAGFQPIMPTYQGLVTEEQLMQLVAYVQSLSRQGEAPTPGTSAATPAAVPAPNTGGAAATPPAPEKK